MRSYFEPLQPERIYHVFSRSNGNEKLFRSRANYIFFMNKFKKHVEPVADTFSFCFLPNHFHLLIRVKPLSDLVAHFQLIKKRKPESPELLPNFVMERFANWLNSYAKAFNKMYDWKGALFMDYLRRVEIKDNNQFL